MARNDKNKTFEDVTIAFRNFAGKEDTYNRAGDKNFAIILKPEHEEELLRDGWNVKYLKARDEGDEPQPYIQVALSYKNKPPRVAMVTSGNISYLEEDDVHMLDWVDIEEADVTLNPYEWAVNGKTGVKAYVQSLFIKIEEDYLMTKWEAYVESGREGQKQIESGNVDYIDAEYIEDQKLLEGAR